MSMHPHQDPQGAYPAVATLVNFQGLLRELFQKYKIAAMHPNVATFEAELPAATWQRVWAGAIIWAAAWAIGLALSSLVNRTAYSEGPSFGILIGAFVVFVGAFFFGVGVMQLIAKLFQGSASFRTYAYALSLALVPVTAIGAVAFIIPGLGALLFFAAQLYGIYLCVLATQAAHRVTVGKAWAIVLIPSAAAVLLSFLFDFLLLFLLIALSGAGH